MQKRQCKEWIERLEAFRSSLENDETLPDTFLDTLQSIKSQISLCSVEEVDKLLALLRKLESVCARKRDALYKEICKLDACETSLKSYGKY